LTDDRLIVIAVFHDLNMASRYCEELILLKEGKIVSFGRTEEVLTSENIRNVFDISASIKRDPSTNSLSLMVIPKKKEKQKNF
jgi:ABC-type cobalamin/Fe3+-siderophores transport systems, ATPase components